MGKYEGPNDIKLINAENPRIAAGVLPYSTNDALAKRDYSISCTATRCIIVIKGYHVWWCSSHHQPHFKCNEDKNQQVGIKA